MIEAVMIRIEIDTAAHGHGGRVGRDPWRVEDPGWTIGETLHGS